MSNKIQKTKKTQHEVKEADREMSNIRSEMEKWADGEMSNKKMTLESSCVDWEFPAL
jgi:hypothetical protein